MITDAGAPVVKLDEYASDSVSEVDSLFRDRHLCHGSQSGSHSGLKIIFAHHKMVLERFDVS